MGGRTGSRSAAAATRNGACATSGAASTHAKIAEKNVLEINGKHSIHSRIRLTLVG
jgi:hypothetical protein